MAPIEAPVSSRMPATVAVTPSRTRPVEPTNRPTIVSRPAPTIPALGPSTRKRPSITIVLPVRNGRMSRSSERVTSSRPNATRTIGSRYDSWPIA
jgi:hypothetical protein